MIGWVYEADRNKQKQAQKDLDDFYLQDNIDDLTNAKDKELEILDERIDHWNKYLEMLEYQYDEFNRLEERRLLMETLGVSSEEEIYSTLLADMTTFNTSREEMWKQGIYNAEQLYQEYNSEFEAFFTEYKRICEELKKYTTSWLDGIISEEDREKLHGMNDDIVNRFILPEEDEGLTKAQKIHQMWQNSQAWGDADEAERKRLADENLELGTSLGWTRNDAGVWLDKNGQNAYDSFLNTDWMAQAQQALMSGNIDALRDSIESREVKADIRGLVLGTNGLQTTTDGLLTYLQEQLGLQVSTLTANNLDAQESANMLAAIQKAGIDKNSQEAQALMSIASLSQSEITAAKANQLTGMIANNLNFSSVIGNIGTMSGMMDTDFYSLMGNDDELMSDLSTFLGVEFGELCAAFGEYAAAAQAAATAVKTQQTVGVVGAGGGGGGSGDNGDSSFLGALAAYHGHNSTGENNPWQSDIDEIAAAQADWQDAHARGDQAGMDAAHDRAEAVRNSYGYSGGSDGSGFEYIGGSHAEGIKTGPVTYTGLGMLHGTPSNPEYVLNNDQAYNVLRYIAEGNKTPEYESTTTNNSSDVYYVVEGDIVIDECNDPTEFANKLMSAVGNRFNVTKNQRK